MKLYTLVLTGITLFSGNAFAAPPSLLDDSMRTAIANQVDNGVFPGLVIGIVDGGHQEFAAFGSTADGEHEAPDENTLYEIGSVTKTFTALLLADAVERGAVSLDDPVQKFLPDFTIPEFEGRSITLVDLATQSSGLPRLPANLLPTNPENPYVDYTLEDLKAFLAGYQLPRAPGKAYEYSNLGFGLLGLALAHQAGAPYSELVSKRITGPLAMSDTTIAISPDLAERFVPGHQGNSGEVTPAWDLGVFEGAGALRSTAHDLLLYVSAFMHPSGPLAKAMSMTLEPRRPAANDTNRIGLAWQIEMRNGKTVVWHNGMTGGYASFVGFVPESDRGVVVLTNIGREVAPVGMAVLAGQPGMIPATPSGVALPAGTLKEYEGLYRLAPGFDLTVRVGSDGLLVQATGQPQLPVYASAQDEFFYRAVDAQLSFNRDEQGEVTTVVLHQNGRDMNAPRVGDAPPEPAQPKEIALDAAALENYVGLYSLTPTFALRVTVENGQLYVQATGQGRSPVFPSAPDEFFSRVVDAQFSFVRDEAGTVTSLVLHQNGQNLNANKQ